MAIEFTDKQLDLLMDLVRYTSLSEPVEKAQAQMVPLMQKYNKDIARRKPNPDCSGGATCPCICHDTGGADYGTHGPNGGRCKGKDF